jgi:hypothetical protein
MEEVRGNARLFAHPGRAEPCHPFPLRSTASVTPQAAEPKTRRLPQSPRYPR